MAANNKSKEEKTSEEAAGPGESAAGAGAASGGQKMTEEELRAELEKRFREQNVEEMLVQVLVSLSTMAYVKMGLTDDTREYRDFGQARLAIDSFKAVLDAVGDRLDKQEAQALAGALASMQVTFAREMGGGAEGPAGESGQPAGADGETGEGGKKPGEGGGPSGRLWVPGQK